MSETNPPAPAPPAARKPYSRPTVTKVPLVPEELFVADCAKTPSICHPVGAHNKVKS